MHDRKWLLRAILNRNWQVFAFTKNAGFANEIVYIFSRHLTTFNRSLLNRITSLTCRWPRRRCQS